MDTRSRPFTLHPSPFTSQPSQLAPHPFTDLHGEQREAVGHRDGVAPARHHRSPSRKRDLHVRSGTLNVVIQDRGKARDELCDSGARRLKPPNHLPYLKTMMLQSKYREILCSDLTTWKWI